LNPSRQLTGCVWNIRICSNGSHLRIEAICRLSIENPYINFRISGFGNYIGTLPAANHADIYRSARLIVGQRMKRDNFMSHLSNGAATLLGLCTRVSGSAAHF